MCDCSTPASQLSQDEALDALRDVIRASHTPVEPTMQVRYFAEESTALAGQWFAEATIQIKRFEAQLDERRDKWVGVPEDYEAWDKWVAAQTDPFVHESADYLMLWTELRRMASAEYEAHRRATDPRNEMSTIVGDHVVFIQGKTPVVARLHQT
jgi:hypothetical protein